MSPPIAVHTLEPVDLREGTVPRYVVERTFAGGLDIAADDAGAERCKTIICRNADLGVTWLCSYVSDDRTRVYCVYDAPSPEAVRQAARRNGLPVDRITRVSVLDPYFYR